MPDRTSDAELERQEEPRREFSGSDTLEPISWERWFKAFDENELGLLVQDRTAHAPRPGVTRRVK